jgi:hypothetical protein
MSKNEKVLSTTRYTRSEFMQMVNYSIEKEGVGVKLETPIERINEYCKTPEQLMLFCIFEMNKQILYMLARNQDDAREYATWDSIFQNALAHVNVDSPMMKK